MSEALSAAAGIYVFLFIALYFEVFLLITFLEKRSVTTTKGLKLSRYPSVAVIVPCFNEERTIAATVRSLLALSYPKDRLEIIIVDDGSTDATPTIAKRFEKYVQVKVFSKKNAGKHTALNLGITKSDAELVGCLDADSFVAPDALTEIVRVFNERGDVSAVTPGIKVYEPRGFLPLVQAAEYALALFYRKMFGNLGALFVTPGPFSFYRRTVFETIGPFRSAYNTEDMEMALRMQSNRMKIENAHTAYVYTKVPTTLRALLRQRTRWVGGFLLNSIDYSHLYGNPRFGALGLFVLPTGAISIFAALYFVAYTLYTLISRALETLITAQATGFSLDIALPRFDWFFLNTGTATFIIFLLVALTVFLVSMGKRLGGEKVLSWDILYYVLCYGFIAPLWLARAVFNSALARTAPWR